MFLKKLGYFSVINFFLDVNVLLFFNIATTNLYLISNIMTIYVMFICIIICKFVS